MKSIMLAILGLLVSLSSFAQSDIPESAVDKGSFFVNGGVNIFNTSRKATLGSDSNKATAFTVEFTPRAGYFVTNNLAVGMELRLASNKEERGTGLSEATTKTTTFGLLPLARYYFNNGIFGEAAAGIGFSKTTLEDSLFGDSETKTTNIGFRLGAGYAFFLGEHLAFEPSINYSWESINDDDAPDDLTQSLSSLFFNLGITAYF